MGEFVPRQHECEREHHSPGSKRILDRVRHDCGREPLDPKRRFRLEDKPGLRDPGERQSTGKLERHSHLDWVAAKLLLREFRQRQPDCPGQHRGNWGLRQSSRQNPFVLGQRLHYGSR